MQRDLTSRLRSYVVHGVYLWRVGAFFGVASPALLNESIASAYLDLDADADRFDRAAQSDSLFPFSRDASERDALRAAWRYDALELRAMFNAAHNRSNDGDGSGNRKDNGSVDDNDDGQSCYLKIFLQFDELKPGEVRKISFYFKYFGEILILLLYNCVFQSNRARRVGVIDDDVAVCSRRRSANSMSSTPPLSLTTTTKHLTTRRQTTLCSPLQASCRRQTATQRWSSPARASRSLACDAKCARLASLRASSPSALRSRWRRCLAPQASRQQLRHVSRTSLLECRLADLLLFFSMVVEVFVIECKKFQLYCILYIYI